MTDILPTGPCPAKIMIVGEFPGLAEMQKGIPFAGAAGDELSRLLQEVGIFRSACFMTNVLRIRPPEGDIGAVIAQKKSHVTKSHLLLGDKYVLHCVDVGIRLLKQEISMCRPNVIIALGNTALWALTGKWGITSWRGSVMECELEVALDYKPKVIPTYPPSMLFRQWSLRPIVLNDLRRAARQAEFREVIRTSYSFITRPSLEQVLSILYQLHTQVQTSPKKCSVDIETRLGHITCVGIAWSDSEAISIPFVYPGTLAPYWSESDEALIIYALYQLLTHKNCCISGQNFLYDAQYFDRHFLFLPNLTHDTMLQQHAMFSSLPKSLDFLSSLYCEDHYYWKDEGKDWDASIPDEVYWEYNCKDCVRTFSIAEAQTKAAIAMGMGEVVAFQQSLFFPVLHTMLKGIRYDKVSSDTLALTLQDEIAERETWMLDVLGTHVNLGSPPQMCDLFYTQLGQAVIKGRKTGNPTCDDEALRKIASREPLLKPIVDKISERRSLGVFLSTFIRAPTDQDGRMRCSFNPGGTETYRFSSSKNAFKTGLNLQNIPSGEEGDSLSLPNVRKLFLPDLDHTFFDIDLSSADLRIVVWEADETEMKAMLKAGLDPYTEIAKEFYHDPTITKKDPRRQTFKSFAHGTNYLGTAAGLAERLGLSIHQAEQTQKWYFDRFPRIKKWQNNLKDQVIKRRMVENVFGYRCYFFDRIEGTIFNEAAAWIPQSTVACLINRAYVKIHHELPQVDVLLQVHDSLAGQFPTNLESTLIPQIVAKAQIELPYPGDPLVIPVGVKTSRKSWGDCA